MNPAPRRTLTWRAKRLVKRVLGIRKPSPGDNWNHWWTEKFDGYAALPTRLENVIELGCGPYSKGTFRDVFAHRQEESGG